jgi:hypothetical protein
MKYAAKKIKLHWPKVMVFTAKTSIIKYLIFKLFKVIEANDFVDFV